MVKQVTEDVRQESTTRQQREAEGTGEGEQKAEGSVLPMAARNWEDRKGQGTRHPSDDLPPTWPQLRLSITSP